MKALTIWQPWATLIIIGAKPFEFRGWRTPRSLIGQRVVIHAAKRKVDPDECRALYKALMAGGDDAAMTCLIPGKALPLLSGKAEPMPVGCGIGTAILGEPRSGTAIAAEFGVSWANDSDRDDHANWGWPMLDIEQWAKPIEMRGAQGFWEWPTPARDGLL